MSSIHQRVSTPDLATQRQRAADRLEIAEIVLDRAALLVFVRGRPCRLAPQEFRLLDALMRSADRVVSQADLIREVWGEEFTGDRSTLQVHMLRIRRKLERHLGADHHLRTVRGMGYIFDSLAV